MISLRQVSQNPPIHSPCSAIELDTGRSYGTWRGRVSKRLWDGATAGGEGARGPLPASGDGTGSRPVRTPASHGRAADDAGLGGGVGVARRLHGGGGPHAAVPPRPRR